MCIGIIYLLMLKKGAWITEMTLKMCADGASISISVEMKNIILTKYVNKLIDIH